MAHTDTDTAKLRAEWETLMELRYDTMPAWWWNRAKREAEFQAHLAARSATKH